MRRILWNIYAWPVTLMLLSGDFWAGCHYKGNYIIIFAVLDFLISFPSIVAMHLHIWDKKLFNPSFWKTYAFAFCAWDFSFNLLIEPAITGEKCALSNLIVLIILLPFYVALFRYAFRQWKVNEERVEIPPAVSEFVTSKQGINTLQG